MHVTDWFPTILDFGKCSQNSQTAVDQNLPLDGVSQAQIINQSNEEKYMVRDEILHELNPLAYVPGELKDPRGNWKDDHESPLHGRCFGIGVRAAIRMVEIQNRSYVPSIKL